MKVRRRLFPLAMIALGIVGLLFVRHHRGPGQVFLRAHGANVSFSFAAVFLISLFGDAWPRLRSGMACAAVALLGVAGQELAQGVGIYPGVFDPMDFLFDAVGVGAAWGVMALVRRSSPA